MKIGKLVKQHVQQIFEHCETADHGEIDSLLTLRYSKTTFDLNFPFCVELANIPEDRSMRYWAEVYIVRGRRVRVTSQWFESSRPHVLRYLASKNIVVQDQETIPEHEATQSNIEQSVQSPSSRANSRYRGSAIGNAQNAFIRTILSSIGRESFREEDWLSTKAYFLNRCAYCGAQTELLMEHAIPINRKCLGEHRLGNLVPSCQLCNSNKGGQDFRVFLEGKPDTIRNIEAYMTSRNYVPLDDDEQLKLVLNMAYKEVALLADRYITIINEVFAESTHNDDYTP
jgi:5-methylcytosine-specific restriction endonuclease McrA